MFLVMTLFPRIISMKPEHHGLDDEHTDDSADEAVPVLGLAFLAKRGARGWNLRPIQQRLKYRCYEPQWAARSI